MDNVSSSTEGGLPGKKSSINSTGHNKSLLVAGGKSSTTSQSRSVVTRPRSESQGISGSNESKPSPLPETQLNGKEKSQSPAAPSAKQNSSSPKTTSRIGQSSPNSNITGPALPTNTVNPPHQVTGNSQLVKNSTRVPSNPQHPANRTSMVKSTVGFDRSRSLRAQVERAIREHKIYSCIGVYPAVRKALQKRGWVEKNPSLGIVKSTNLGSKELESRALEDESDQAWMNRVLKDISPDFIWVIRRDNIDWRSLHKDQIINRYPKAFFTTKVGIAACLQNIHWFSESEVSDTFFPRCYRLCIEEEKAAFIDDYRLSACMGLLKWVVNAFEKEGESGVMDSSSRVVSLAVDFAIRQVNNYVRMRRHEDIDWLMPPAFMGQHWDVFLNQYYNVVNNHVKLAPSDSQDTGKLKYEASKRALSRLAPYWPQLNIDGTSNIWICKPGARSRGKGIIIMNQLEKILDLLAQNNHREANWVVQKYIERPLLIYKTKFDIRQWFIVSDWAPLTVWFYKESYIRFCTKPFSMEDFHESIHLCNNAVQCRYQNSDQRDTALPDENMWDCYTFQAYLKTQGKMDYWDSLIYPGMKQGILGVLLASQDTVDVRKNCFELYGADFMLSEDLRPWLIEINSCPCMAPSTSVTARMCAQCLEDTVKVIVDRREDRNADTGMFELIYKQQNLSSMPLQPFNGVELIIQGKKLSRDVDWPSIMTKYNSKRGSQSSTSSSLRLKSARTPSIASNGLTFMDLVQRLRLKEGQSSSLESVGSSASNNNSSSSGKSVSNKGGNKSSDPPSIEQKQKQAQHSRKMNESGSKPTESSLLQALDNIDGGLASLTTNIFKKGQPPVNPPPPSTQQQQQETPIVKASPEQSTMKSPPNSSQRRAARVTEQQHYVSSTETSLSTLLKSSLTNGQPTMADLVRISKEAAQESLNRAKKYGTDKPKENDENSSISTPDNNVKNFRPLSTHNQNQPQNSTKTVSSGTSTGTHRGMANGKIRPNARTQSNPNPASSTSFKPKIRSTHQQNSVNDTSSSGSKGKEQDGTPGSQVIKYGKLQSSSFHDIYKINNNQSSLGGGESSKKVVGGKAGKRDSCESSSTDSGLVEEEVSARSGSMRDSTTSNDFSVVTSSGRGSNSSSSNNCSLVSNDDDDVDIVIYLDENVNFSPPTGPESNIDCKSQVEHCRSTHDRLTSLESETVSSSKSPVAVVVPDQPGSITTTFSNSQRQSLTKGTRSESNTINTKFFRPPREQLKCRHKTFFANPPPGRTNSLHPCHHHSKFGQSRKNESSSINSKITHNTNTSSSSDLVLRTKAELKKSMAEDENGGMTMPHNVGQCVMANTATTTRGTDKNIGSHSALRPEAQIQNDLNTSDMLAGALTTTTTTTTTFPNTQHSKHDQTTTKISSSSLTHTLPPQLDNPDLDESRDMSKSTFIGKDTNNNFDFTLNPNPNTRHDSRVLIQKYCEPMSNSTCEDTRILSKNFLLEEKLKLLNPYFPLNLTSHDSIDDDKDDNNNNHSNSDDDDYDANINLDNCPTLLTPPIFRRCKLPRTLMRSSKSSRHGSKTHTHCINNYNNNSRFLHQTHHPHPCYRIALDHPPNKAALFSSKKFLLTLPLKTVNLNLT